MSDTIIIEELTSLKKLLFVEKEADLEFHRKKVQSLPLEERVKDGYSWYPVQVVKRGFTHGNKAFVIIERNAPFILDQFRSGKTVNLFTRQTSNNAEKQGIIQYAESSKMKIVFNNDEFPDWLSLGMIGVNLLFDEKTYLEMEKALNQVIQARGNRIAELRDIILGKNESIFHKTTPNLIDLPLNESQQLAVQKAVAAKDLAVIHGPPGTGKTTTLIEIAKQLCQTEATILVCAPSNTAVDLLTEKLAEAHLNVLRLGNISRVDETILKHTLDLQLSQHPESKTIKKLKIEAAAYRNKAMKYKRRMGRKEHLERKNLFREAGEMNKWAKQLEDRLIQQLVTRAQVITCTLVGATNSVIAQTTFKTTIIDEAAQGLEAATWIPILKASKAILIGDPFQLPPTVKSKEAAKAGFNITLIEKALQRHEIGTLLQTQYRMNSKIMQFSNIHFYEQQLKAHPSVAHHLLENDVEGPLVFIDTAGTDFDEKIHPLYQSRYNEGEALILREHLLLLKQSYQEQEIPPIAIISPYREQVLHLRKLFKEDADLQTLPVQINTIDGFQGQERDIVYISLVRSNSKGEIGFLKDYRRMNVAMTRARKKLIIIGDSATIGSDSFFNDFLAYCEENGTYKTAWEYMMN